MRKFEKISFEQFCVDVGDDRAFVERGEGVVDGLHGCHDLCL